MAELIGLISSIIGIAGAGLTLAQKLHDYGDGVSGSSRRAQQIASYVRTTAICIEEVGSVLEEERVSDRVIVSRNALDTVRDIVGQCDGLFEQIEAALRSTGSGNGMGRLLFPFRESRVVLMQSDLERLKTTLQLLMQVVVYARVRAVQSEYQPRQRQLVEELIALRRQAMDTYERSRKEDERVEAMEDASIFTAALPGAATGPSASDNVAREIPPTAKGDDNLENPKSNPTVDHPPQTQDSSPDTSNMEITTIQPPDPNPTDSSNQPMSTSTARTQDTVEPVPPTHIPLHPIPRPQPTTPPRHPKHTTNPPQPNETLHDFLSTFHQSLKFICCCPCLYIHRRSTRTHESTYLEPIPDPLLGMGIPSYQGGYPPRPAKVWHSRGGYVPGIQPLSGERFEVVPQGMIYPAKEAVRFSRMGLGDSVSDGDDAVRTGVEGLSDMDDVEELLERWTNLYRGGGGEGVEGNVFTV